jgi:hypothetical protein
VLAKEPRLQRLLLGAGIPHRLRSSLLESNQVFAIISEASPADESVLLSNETPQGKAVEWIRGSEDNIILSDRNRVLQRFALATIFFATLGEGWAQKTGWLSSEQ